MKRAALITLGLAGGVLFTRLRADFELMRATHLELFDGAAASASVAICLDEYEREEWQ